MSRRKGCTSFAVLNRLPTITTALRIRPADTSDRRRRRLVPLRLQQAGYALDGVLDAATQQQVYQQLCCPLVDGLLTGESAVLLVYGAYQSGKSYTLQGVGSNEDAGIVLQAVQAITTGLSIVPRNKYRLSATYCGLGVGHDAQLVDLLAPRPASAASLRDGSATAALSALSSWTILAPADIQEVMRCRQTPQACTPSASKQAMHTMLTLQLDSYSADGIVVNTNHLSFVELAAPEPKGHGGNSRCTEAATARSMAMAYSSLSKVLQALRHSAPATALEPGPTGAAAAALAAGIQNSMHQLQHVPWRDSPLTRWLQERLHAARRIALLGTVTTSIEDAADTLATISWISRFSATSNSGHGGVLVSFAWDVAADPQLSGPYMRFQPEEQVIKGTGVQRQEQLQHPQRPQQQPIRRIWVEQRSNTPAAKSLCDLACSSPMVNQRSPDLHDRVAPHSAESACNKLQPRKILQQMQQQQQQYQQQYQQAPQLVPVNSNIEHWQQQQEQLQGQAEAADSHSPQRHALVARSAAGTVLDQGRLMADEVLLYGELMTALHKKGGNLRAETILQQLIQDLSHTRATSAAAQRELKSCECRLLELQHQHAECEVVSKALQERNLEAQQQVAKLQASLHEAAADRDLFLRRLQQLEADSGNDGHMCAAEAQWQKSHTAQLQMLEAELAAVSSSNQQLRSQLEMATQQLSRIRSAAESATEGNDQLQLEIDVMRSAADIEGELRRELEASVQQLQQACEVTAHELSLVTADKVSLQQQCADVRNSMEALAEELQEALAKVDEKETEVQALAEQLEDEQQQRQAAEQQLSGLQAQVSALEEVTQHLQQQQQQDTADDRKWQVEQQNTMDMLNSTLKDLHDVLSDFERDLKSAVPQQWKQLVPGLQVTTAVLGQLQVQYNSSLGVRISQLYGRTQSSALTLTAAPGDSRNADCATGMSPLAWARKLQGVIEVLRTADEELTHATDEVANSMHRSELLERNVEELRKLVSTQEDLQQQLATQLTSCRKEADAAAQQHKASQQQLQDSLAEAQAAVTALAEELQECQASLGAAQDSVLHRDQALDVLADEYVELSTSHDGLEAHKQELDEQVNTLAAELEETLLQLSIRDQVLGQVWGQLKGLANCTASVKNNPTRQTPDGTETSTGMISGSFEQDYGNTNRYESASLQRLKQQRQQRRGQQRRRSIMDADAVQGSQAAGVAYQAVQAARRRTTTSEAYQSPEHNQAPTESGWGRDQPATLYDRQRVGRLTHADDKLQQSQLQGSAAQGTQSRENSTAAYQVQSLVVAAVQQLCNNFEELQQQVAHAQAGGAQNTSLQQQLADVKRQYVQLIATSQQQEEDNVGLQAKCRQLSQQLRTKEMEADNAQERCQELVCTLKQVQQHLQQQQHLVQPVATTTAQQQAELSECKRQLADTQTRLAEVTTLATAEKAARIAAEDIEVERQQLLQQLGSLRQDLSDLHAKVLAERQTNCAIRDELTLVTKSRDTWRESARRAEAAATAAKTAAETKSIELTRARAEVLTLKQQLETTTQQLEAQQARRQKESELGCTDTVAEGIAARLAAAQVMRREAEDNAAELGRRLAATEKKLQRLQQEREDGQLAQDAVAGAPEQTAVENSAGQLSGMTQQLAHVQAENDRLHQQLLHLQQQLPSIMWAGQQWTPPQHDQQTSDSVSAAVIDDQQTGNNREAVQAGHCGTRTAASVTDDLHS